LYPNHQVDVWTGQAVSTATTNSNFALETVVAFLPDGITPVYVNVTHPLWIQTSAAIRNFSNILPDGVFDIPEACLPALNALHAPPVSKQQ
jgi:hypothetical protein